MNPIFVLVLLIVCCIQPCRAQNLEENAFQFSMTQYEGSSRSISLGGAMSAIGGDISSLSYNPAGIALYNSSIFSISPSINGNTNRSSYLNSSTLSRQATFNFSGLGGVFTFKNKENSIFKVINFGIGFTNLNNFNQRINYQRKSLASITQQFVNEVLAINGMIEAPIGFENFSFETVGAYQTFLVNYDTSLNTYTTPIEGEISQSSRFESKGSKKEISIALGTKLSNKLYLGGALSLNIINYFSNTVFRERDEDRLIAEFEDFRLINEYKNTGTGLNAKIGFIYRPIAPFRISAAFHTASRLRLTEEFNTSFISNFSLQSFEFESGLGKFTYIQTMPWRANAGLALVLQKWGFIALDYELVNFNSIKFIFQENFDEIALSLNETIQTKYNTAHKFKIGIEYKIQQFRLRGGFKYENSPLSQNLRTNIYNFSAQNYSIGLGYLFKNLAIDMAYSLRNTNNFVSSHDPLNNIFQNNKQHLFSTSLAIRLNSKKSN